jgi:hypothetical protein
MWSSKGGGMNGVNRHVIFRLFIPYGEHKMTLYG